MQATARLQRKKKSERERDPAAAKRTASNGHNGHGAPRGVPSFLTDRLDHAASAELTQELGEPALDRTLDRTLDRPLDLDAMPGSAPARVIAGCRSFAFRRGRGIRRVAGDVWAGPGAGVGAGAGDRCACHIASSGADAASASATRHARSAGEVGQACQSTPARGRRPARWRRSRSRKGPGQRRQGGVGPGQKEGPGRRG